MAENYCSIAYAKYLVYRRGRSVAAGEGFRVAGDIKGPRPLQGTVLNTFHKGLAC